jgi:hypothetical protein
MAHGRLLRVLALAALAAPALPFAAFQVPGPLFVNLGPGDEPFVRGFREGWERDGLHQTGETQFRWAREGSALELPLRSGGDRLQARLRVARFVPPALEVEASQPGGQRASWPQPARGWRVLELDLGRVEGQLRVVLGAKPPLASGDLLVALDWLELRPESWLWPEPGLVARILALQAGVPLLVGLLLHRDAGLVTSVVLGLGGALAVGLDRLGGLLALGAAGFPALLLTLAVAVGTRVLGRRWPEACPAAGLLALATALAGLVALSHPFFYYPDVDTHADLVARLGAAPGLLLDPRPYQQEVGAWMRTVGGQLVPFPYSTVFHALAWPLATAFGPPAAVKALALLGLGATVLLTYALARALERPHRLALLAQALVATLPVTASRLTLALYPALLAQGLELGLLVLLASGAPWSPAGTLFLLVAVQAAYTGSLFNVGLTVGILALLELWSGAKATAVRLSLLWAAAAVLVVSLQYGRFLPTLWHSVLPGVAAEGAAAGAGAQAAGLAAPLLRLATFYGAAHALLFAPGLVALRGGGRARRALAAALAAGGLLLVLRFALPVLFRDVKEIELLAAPVAVTAAAGAGWLSRRGRTGRLLATAAVAICFAWSAQRAVDLYGARFVEVGRWPPRPAP